MKGLVSPSPTHETIGKYLYGILPTFLSIPCTPKDTKVSDTAREITWSIEYPGLYKQTSYKDLEDEFLLR